MTGISITVGLRDERASHDLRALLERMEQRLPFYRKVGNLLVGSASENFRREAGPDGTPWTPLRAATIRARMRNKQTPITILKSNSKGKIGSTLSGSINFEATADEVRIGSPVVYAAIHQLGGTIQKAEGKRWMAGRRFARKSEAPEGRDVPIAAHSIVIPARPFIGVSAADEEDILDLAEDWLIR